MLVEVRGMMTILLRLLSGNGLLRGCLFLVHHYYENIQLNAINTLIPTAVPSATWRAEFEDYTTASNGAVYQ